MYVWEALLLDAVEMCQPSSCILLLCVGCHGGREGAVPVIKLTSWPKVFISGRGRSRLYKKPETSTIRQLGGVPNSCISLAAVPSKRNMEERVLLEVRVPGVLAGEEVRVSGSVEALGRWRVHESIPLRRKST